MAQVLAELLLVLSSQKEKVTPEEAKVIVRCKSKAVREFTAGAFVGGCAALAATWKLNKFVRFYVTGGAAVIVGSWRFHRSLESCVDHILDLNGSRMQRELAKIFVNKHQNDHWLMKRMHRHFYSEKVFDDSSLDKPILRWRYRNFFGDNVAYGQSTNDSEAQSESDNVSHNDSDSKKAHAESKQVFINSSADVMEDPLDSIFGCMTPVEEIHHPSTSNKPARTLTHSHRRSHRRRRMLHRKSLGLKQVQPQQI